MPRTQWGVAAVFTYSSQYKRYTKFPVSPFLKFSGLVPFLGHKMHFCHTCWAACLGHDFTHTQTVKRNIKHLCQHSMCKFSGSDDLYSAIRFAFLFPVHVFGSCFRMLVVILVYFIYFIFSLSHIFTTFRR